MELRVLGPLEVFAGGSVVPVGARKHRELLLLLLLEPDRAVAADVLVDELWEGEPPRSAASVLRTYVGQLRRLLPPEAVLEGTGGRYRLHVDPATLDAVRFAELVERASAAVTADPRAALATLRAALALWRGRPYDEVADRPCAAAEVARLEGLRWEAVEALGEAELALGLHRELVPELEHRVAQAPLRETLRAQLVLALYRSGRQADALAAYDALRRLLDAELGLEPSEPLRRLQAQVLRHDPSLDRPAAAPVAGVAPPAPVPPAPVPPARGPGLPFPVTAFVGREGEVDDLVDLLGRHRLVTLTGPGGAGKTRLALEVGHRARRRDGVRWVELAGVRDAEGVVRAVADALPGPDPARGDLGAVAAQVAELDVLLLVDNCEHLVGPVAAVVARLLAAGPHVHVLATSRRPLELPGELTWPVAPLALPPPTVASLDELVAFDAGALLADRARLVRPRAALTPAEVAVAAEVCRRLDGLPLALEIAAGRLRTMTLPGLAAVLERRLDLANRDPTAPERQRSLRALLDWSVGLLTPPQRHLLARLAALPAPPTVDGVAAAAAVDPVVDGDVPTLLEDLVEHSLVAVDPGLGAPRYVLLDVVREHALGLLPPGEAERLRAALGGGSAPAVLDLCAAEERSGPPTARGTGARAPRRPS